MTAPLRAAGRALAALALAWATGCSGIETSMRYHEAEGVTAHLDAHQSVLRHTPAGAYSWSATAPAQGKVVLSIAGVTNAADQDALLGVLRSKRFDERRDWNEIRVTFYEKTEFAPNLPGGVSYVHALRSETVE